MKKAIRKWINFICIALALAVAGFILYSATVYQRDYPDYSSYNTTPDGIKALYLLAREMGFDARRTHYPARFLGDVQVMVVFRPAASIFNEEKEQTALAAWLDLDNTLILVPDPDTLRELWIFEKIAEKKQSHEVINTGNITTTWYTLERGRVCVMDQADAFLNGALRESSGALVFMNALERAGNRKVVFNEYYRYLQKPAPGLWDLLGIFGQLIAVQLVLAVVFAVVRGWKPVGRVRDGRVLQKRPENEVQKALSGLYIRMKAYPLALSNYFGYFTQRYERALSMPGPLQEKAHRVLSACARYIEENRRNRKEMLFLVQQLEQLEAELSGSRSTYGKYALNRKTKA